MDPKKPWQSKTVITGAVLAIAPLIPGVGEVVRAHPEESVSLVSGLMLILRFVTGGGIKFN